MKLTSALALIIALSASTLVVALADEFVDVTHQMIAVVKDVDMASGKVTLAHEPVKSLNWPAMTMGFRVKDRTLFDKLVTGKKVKAEFIQQGSDYVVTAVK